MEYDSAFRATYNNPNIPTFCKTAVYPLPLKVAQRRDYESVGALRNLVEEFVFNPHIGFLT